MVIDTSALVAIVLGEPERWPFIKAIQSADTPAMSAASFVEASIVLESRFGADGLYDLDFFVRHAGIELVSVDPKQAQAAARGFSRFGKGRHRAALNFGDCFSYALATTRGERLLFKGDDFPHTDVAPFDWSDFA